MIVNDISITEMVNNPEVSSKEFREIIINDFMKKANKKINECDQ